MLPTLEQSKRHVDIKLNRVPDTGTWFLHLESFCNWSNGTKVASKDYVSKDRIFCCYGMPGAGKTKLRYLYIRLLVI